MSFLFSIIVDGINQYQRSGFDYDGVYEDEFFKEVYVQEEKGCDRGDVLGQRFREGNRLI